MIYTFTPNPAIDLNVNANTLSTQQVNRTRDAVYTPNGKGLNVSFTLKHFGQDAPILGFFGGFSGKYIVSEAAKICPVYPIWVDGITRINMFVSTPKGEYKFPNAGAEVPRIRQSELLDFLPTRKDMDCLVVSGSLPPGIAPSFYAELKGVCDACDTDLILDTSHPVLADVVQKAPFLIKPNNEELHDIFGFSCTTEAEILHALKTLHNQGAQHILLTLGERGAYFSNAAHIWHAYPLQIQMLSSACAGDATLAAFLSLWYEDHSLVEPALKRAMATGANVAESAGLGEFSHVANYTQEVIVERVM